MCYEHLTDADYNGVPHSVNPSLYDDDLTVNYLRYCNEHFAGNLPVLSHYDLKCFKNRLRNRFRFYCKKQNIDYEPVFIYSVGEYGPTSFRPHFHILLCSNTKFIADICESCVRACWCRRSRSESRTILTELGFIDFQTVINGSTSAYIAQYLNCDSHLPNILSRSVFRPFFSTSNITDYERSRYDCGTLQSFYKHLPVEVNFSSSKDSKPVVIPTPSHLENRFVPKFVGFNKVPPVYRIELYRVASTLSRQDFVNEWLEFFYLSWCNWNLTTLSKILYDLYVKDSTPFTTELNLNKLWYVSRRVLDNAKSLGVSLDVYISAIDNYYHRKEQYKLKQFYELQEYLIKYEKVSLSSIHSLYYNTDNYLSNSYDYEVQFGGNSSFNKIPSQRNYYTLMTKIINDTTKTKKRNDYFTLTSRKRPRYIPKIKSSILKSHLFT